MKGTMATVATVAALGATSAAALTPVPVGDAASGQAVTPAPATIAQVRVVSRAPLTLQVARRKAGERVRVVVSVQGRVFTRVVIARGDGTAVLKLSDVLLRRCQPVYVRVGALPARLQVVRLPSLDCAPTT